MARTHLRTERSQSYAWFITIPLALLATALTVGAVARHSPVYASIPAALLYFGLFCVADATTIKLEVRRTGIQVSVAEVPLLLALVYLPPLTVVTVRVAAQLALLVYRRIPVAKLAFNVVNVAAGAAAASLIIASAGHLNRMAPHTWLLLIVAVNVTGLVTMAGVVSVISLVQGHFWTRDLISAVVSSVIPGTVNGITGLAVLLIIQASPWAVLVVIALAVAIVLLYRAYAQFLRQHKSLAEIYELARAIAETPPDASLADALLERVRSLLSAEHATLWLRPTGRYPESLLSARPDDRGLIDLGVTPTAVRQRAVDSGTTIMVSPTVGDEDLRAVMRESGVKDVIVAPLRSGGHVIGTLEVAVRMRDNAYFSADDVRLLETLAAHAAVAVENSRLVDRLRFDAEHDTLTGLPNRRRMIAALQEAVRISASGDVVALIAFDVDGVREVNDSLGHAAGDRLLIEFARRLRALSPAKALVARVGGDTFAVTLRIEDADEAMNFAREVHAALNQPMQIGSLSLDLNSAVGVTVHPDHGSEPATLLQQADVATQAAKVRPEAVQLFDPSLESRSVRRLGLAADLRRALDAGDLEMSFQPKVTLAGRTLAGVECLPRWHHPVHGEVARDDFLAVAEHTGQLGRLTEFVLREVLHRARAWVAAGQPMPVSVNVSPRMLAEPGFPDRVQSLLAEYEIPTGMLTLEISADGGELETDRQSPVLHRLGALGVRLAVDDFGTGHSFAYLRQLPVNEVKIDRSFVLGMATDPGDRAIVRAIVDLSRHLDLVVVAEGVESERTVTLLGEMGCDVGQGFLFSRPLSYDRLVAWLAAQTELLTGEPEHDVPAPSAGDRMPRPAEVRRLRAVQ